MRPDRTGECVSGEVLRGVKKPGDCPAFGTRCTPERPLGATMVSSEGACAAYYRYRRPPRPDAAIAGARPYEFVMTGTATFTLNCPAPDRSAIALNLPMAAAG